MKTLAIIAIVFGSNISLANWIWFFQNLKNKDQDPHPTPPIFGALFLGLGLAYFEATRPFAFLSIVVDHGTLVFFLAIPHLIREFWQTSRFNLVRKFIANSPNANYEVRLYKGNKFVINVKFNPPYIPNEHRASLVEFGLTGKWQELNGDICFQEHYGRSFKLIQKENNYLMKETNYPDNNQSEYNCLDGVIFSLN